MSEIEQQLRRLADVYRKGGQQACTRTTEIRNHAMADATENAADLVRDHFAALQPEQTEKAG